MNYSCMFCVWQASTTVIVSPFPTFSHFLRNFYSCDCGGRAERRAAPVRRGFRGRPPVIVPHEVQAPCVYAISALIELRMSLCYLREQ